jgi:hypothetical protein
VRRADDLNRHPCSPSLGARLADLRQEHWRHPNVRRGGPFQDRASWCGDFSASRIQDGNPFRARHEVGSGVLRFRPTLCWREMDSDFRFLVPVTRPSNRHGRRDCCLGKGERIWCGTKVRIHLPPAERVSCELEFCGVKGLRSLAQVSSRLPNAASHCVQNVTKGRSWPGSEAGITLA